MVTMYFRQIIFPSIKKDLYYFDYWIIYTKNELELYVKCPICFYTYKLDTFKNEESIKKSIDGFEPYYYRKVIRCCPHHQEI